MHLQEKTLGYGILYLVEDEKRLQEKTQGDGIFCLADDNTTCAHGKTLGHGIETEGGL
jgi:hypothetical protein